MATAAGFSLSIARGTLVFVFVFFCFAFVLCGFVFLFCGFVLVLVLVFVFVAGLAVVLVVAGGLLVPIGVCILKPIALGRLGRALARDALEFLPRRLVKRRVVEFVELAVGRVGVGGLEHLPQGKFCR